MDYNIISHFYHEFNSFVLFHSEFDSNIIYLILLILTSLILWFFDSLKLEIITITQNHIKFHCLMMMTLMILKLTLILFIYIHDSHLKKSLVHLSFAKLHSFIFKINAIVRLINIKQSNFITKKHHQNKSNEQWLQE